jgi:response regulator RpfG family c-di-GMP phosphodiesterase
VEVFFLEDRHPVPHPSEEGDFMNVLIVDSDPDAINAYEETLSGNKYDLRLVYNGVDALELIEAEPIDIVVTAWNMPGMDGIELCRRIYQGGFKRNIYTILISDREANSELIQSLGTVVNDYIRAPVNSIDLTVRLAIGARVVRLEQRIGRDRETLKKTYYPTVRILSHLINVYDEDLGNHSRRVAEASIKLARQHPGVPESDHPTLHAAGLLHDIGMVCVPASILTKSRIEMTANERTLFLSHPIQGESILNENEKLRSVAALVRMHHEQYNGKGFPDALTGDQIPMLAKIITAVSTYDNLIHRGKCSLEDAPTELQRFMGYQIDPGLYDYLIRLNADNIAMEARKKYREVRIDGLTEGMVLARNVRMKGGAMAMPVQTRITAAMIDKLAQYYQKGYVPDKIYVYKQ